MTHIDRSLRRASCVGTIAALVLGACGSSSAGADKAGGDEGPVVLTFGVPNSPGYDAYLDQFAARMTELSGGALQVDMTYEYGKFADEAEADLVEAVASGEFDLALVSTRVFGLLGVNSFEPLSAPFLVDSYELQNAVLASELVDEMAAGLEPLGVRSLALIEGGLQRPVAVDAPVLAPADFAGITFTSQASNLYADAISALGATHRVAWGETREAGLTTDTIDGFEMDLVGYDKLSAARLAPYVTSNVVLWAEPTAIIANPDAIEALDDEHRRWLDEAIGEVADHAAAIMREEQRLVPDLCASGAGFAVAPEDGIAAMRAAVDPVYARLAADATLGAAVERIEEMKATVDPEPPLNVPAACVVTAESTPTTDAPQEAATELDGTWKTTLSLDELVNSPLLYDQGEINDYNWGEFTFTFDGGRFVETQHNPEVQSDGAGTYSIGGDVLTLDRDNGEHFVLRWRVDGTTLTLERDDALGEAPTPYVVKPWERVD